MLEPGTIVGERYRVGGPLGKGGMGVVVEATHLQLGTQVAIKILKKEKADAATVERFLREARAAAKLRGEHICRVHDFGTLPDGAPYMVMERLHGHDLATRLIASGPLEPMLLAGYMLEVCAAIGEAHAAGIIHRDLKPTNLYVVARPDGVAAMKVLDFGIAKSMSQVDMSLTDTANVVGSPAYMSPEQLRSSKNVDGRTDIWSLGVVMYELVTTKHPFKGESITELAISIANDPLPPLPDSVPAAFAAVIRRCLEKTASKRYPDVGSLAAALEPIAKRDGSVATAVARMLRSSSTSIPLPEGDATSPMLPSNLVSPAVESKLAAGQVGLARAVSEVAADKKETTTLRGASGALMAQTGERPRQRLVMPLVAAAITAVVVIVGMKQLGSERDAQPAAMPDPAPAPAPVVAPVLPAAIVDAGVEDVAAPLDAASMQAATTPPPVKPKPGKPQRKPKPTTDINPLAEGRH